MPNPPYTRRPLPASDLKGFLDIEFQNIQRGIPMSAAIGLGPFALEDGEIGVVNQLWPVGDIRRYGAVGNGTKDDTAAIQAAITSTPDGGVVFIPQTTSAYRVTSSILITGRSRLTIEGTGWGSQIQAATPSFDLFAVDTTSSGVWFRDLRLVGSSVGTESKSALTISAGYCRVSGCEISGFNIAVHAWVANWYSGFTDFVADHNYIHDLVGSTSGNGYGVYTVCPQSIISQNRFVNVPRHDVYCSGSDTGANFTVIEGNVSSGNGLEVIALANTSAYPALTGVVVRGNSIVNCVNGIRGDANIFGCSITGNTIDGATQASFQLDGGVNANEQPSGCLITNNTATNAQFDQPILLTNVSRCIVAGNTIQSAGKLNGIRLTSTGSPPEFPTGNQIYGNTIIGQTGDAIYVDTSCVDTVVGPNYFVGSVSIGNDRDIVTVTSTTTPQTVDLAGKGNVGRPIEVIFNQASPVTVTNFTNVREGQEVILSFNTTNAVTVTTANAFLSGGASFVSSQYDTLRLIFRGIYWYELSRSVN